MQAPPTVALGEKDKRSASLGQRVRMHFYNNRKLYTGVGGFILGSAMLGGLRERERNDDTVRWHMEKTPSGHHKIVSTFG